MYFSRSRCGLVHLAFVLLWFMDRLGHIDHHGLNRTRHKYKNTIAWKYFLGVLSGQGPGSCIQM